MTNNEIIDILGGTSIVAKACYVSPAAVAQWRKKGIPKDKVIFFAARLEKVTKEKFCRKVHFPNDYNLIWTDLV